MAMIERNAAVAEMRVRGREAAAIGFAARLGVHTMLVSELHEKRDAFIQWGWDVSRNRPDALIERGCELAIDWGDDSDEAQPRIVAEEPVSNPAAEPEQHP